MRCRINKRKCISITFILCVFLFFFRLACRDLPFSKFYVESGNIQRDVMLINEKLSLEAQKLVNDQLLHSDRSGTTNLTRFDLVIGVITMKRKFNKTAYLGDTGYLTQTVARILSIMKTDRSADFKNKAFFICNVNSIPQQHTEAMNLSPYISVISKYVNETSYSNAGKTTNVSDVHEKQRHDYTYCLRKAAEKYETNFVLMIEDDVLLDDDSIFTLNHLFKTRILNDHKDLDGGVTTKKWLSVKFYFPIKWSGYGYDVDKMIELVGIGIVGGYLAALVSHFLSGLRFRSIVFSHLYRSFAVGALTCIAMAIVVGRVHLHAFRRSSPYLHRAVPAPDCCILAVLYPTSAIDPLTNYLDNIINISTPVDLAISKFGRIHEMSQYLIEPNICKHIGYVSTLIPKGLIFAKEFLSSR